MSLQTALDSTPTQCGIIILSVTVAASSGISQPQKWTAFASLQKSLLSAGSIRYTLKSAGFAAPAQQRRNLLIASLSKTVTGRAAIHNKVTAGKKFPWQDDPNENADILAE
jgi:hypothetical protein